MPDFKLGYAEKERQLADQRVADRKTKTGQIQPIPSQHFSVGVSRFTWDEFAEDDGGNWSSLPNHWAIEEANRLLTSDDLITSILTTIRSRIKRDNVTKWLNPTVTGDWVLGHINPIKGGREIATWNEPKLLSDVIDSGAYDQYKVQQGRSSLCGYIGHLSPLNLRLKILLRLPRLALSRKRRA
jgi:hypothetical protein